MVLTRIKLTLAVLALASMSQAQFTMANGSNGMSFGYTAAPSGVPGIATLHPVSYLPAGSSQAATAMNLINSNFPPASPYNYATLGSGATGTMRLTDYNLFDRAVANPYIAGTDQYSVMAVLKATYTPSPLESNYFWVQTIETNSPASGQTSPYIDLGGQSSPDGTPLYPSQPGVGGGMGFSDTPQRAKPATNNVVNWWANLFLVSYTPNPAGGMGGSLIIRDGLRWGFTLTAVRTQGPADPPFMTTGNSIDGRQIYGNEQISPVPEPIMCFALFPAVLLCYRGKRLKS